MSGRFVQFSLGALCGLVCIGVVLTAAAYLSAPSGAPKEPAQSARSAPLESDAQAIPADGAGAALVPADLAAVTRHRITAPAFSIEAPTGFRRMGVAEMNETFDRHGDARFTPLIGFETERADELSMVVGAAGLRDGDPMAAMSRLNTVHKLLSWVSWIWGSPIAVAEPAHPIDVDGLTGARIVVKYGGDEGAVVATTFLELDFDRLLIVQVHRDDARYREVLRLAVMSIRQG